MLGAAYLLNVISGDTQGVIRSGGVAVPWHVRGERHWISLPLLAVTPIQTPQWLTQLFGDTAPLAAAISGGDADYLVVQWPAGFDLGQLPVPLMLGKFTQRALIATCESRHSQGLADIESRYFAPQYGVPEDPATGSAMRILAMYWQQQGLGTQVSNYQRSANGGLLFGEIVDADHVYVGGQIVPIDEEQTLNAIG